MSITHNFEFFELCGVTITEITLLYSLQELPLCVSLLFFYFTHLLISN